MALFSFREDTNLSKQTQRQCKLAMILVASSDSPPNKRMKATQKDLVPLDSNAKGSCAPLDDACLLEGKLARAKSLASVIIYTVHLTHITNPNSRDSNKFSHKCLILYY